MNELVWMKPIGSRIEPYTTTDRIAEFAEVQHATIKRLVQKHEKDLALFGKVGFDIVPLHSSKTGQSIKIYRLNEQQICTLLTGGTLCP